MTLLRLFFVLVLLLSYVPKLEAKESRTGYALTKAVSIDELKASAGIIFRGSFEDYRILNKNGYDARELKFKVKEVFKGLSTKQKILILTEWARNKSPFTEEMIASDRDYVFFFHQPSDIGFTSLIGMDQGMISINTDKSLVFSRKIKAKKVKKRQYLFFTIEKELDSYQDLKDYLKS